VIAVIAKRQPIDLTPQGPYLRRLQHQLANAYGLRSQSVGREPFRHVIVRPAPHGDTEHAENQLGRRKKWG
jgi:predicted RNA-binding protein Jag